MSHSMQSAPQLTAPPDTEAPSKDRTGSSCPRSRWPEAAAAPLPVDVDGRCVLHLCQHRAHPLLLPRAVAAAPAQAARQVVACAVGESHRAALQATVCCGSPTRAFPPGAPLTPSPSAHPCPKAAPPPAAAASGGCPPPLALPSKLPGWTAPRPLQMCTGREGSGAMPGGLDRWAGHGLHAIMSASRLVVLAVPFLQVTQPRLPSPKSRHPGTLITVHSRRRPPPRLTAAVAAHNQDAQVRHRAGKQLQRCVGRLPWQLHHLLKRNSC